MARELCTACQEANDEPGARYCWNCGAKLSEKEVSPPSTRHIKKSTAVALELVFALVGILGMGWLYLGQRKILIFTLVWGIGMALLVFATAGAGCLCIPVVSLAVGVVSALFLQSRFPRRSSD